MTAAGVDGLAVERVYSDRAVARSSNFGRTETLEKWPRSDGSYTTIYLGATSPRGMTVAFAAEMSSGPRGGAGDDG